MMSKDLPDYAVLTFDCYGTLIDWESGIWDALQPLFMANKYERITRGEGLRLFAKIESDQQASTPGMHYSELLAVVHDRIAGYLGLRSDDELNRTFGSSVPHWPAFPDSADTLRLLAHHFKLVVLSNVDREGFAASNSKLGVSFDAVYTAEDIGAYKPDPRNFDYMIRRLEEEHAISRGDILHTAQSLFHDHVQASEFGLAMAWIDRQGLSSGGGWGATAEVDNWPEVDFVFPNLAEMERRVSDNP